jgi:hypothetical protein
MHPIAGVIIFVLGVILAVLGILKILPGAMQGGFFGVLVGAIVFGLSFIKRPEPGPDAPPPLGPTDRVIGIFFEPTKVFRNLRWHPRWLAAFLVIAFCAVIYHVAFVQRLGPEVIALAPIEKTIEGGWIPEDAAARAREQAIEAAHAPITRVTGPLSEVGGIFLFMLFFAALLVLLVMMFGGRLHYWRAVSIAFYSALPPIAIDKLLSLLLLYLKSPDEIEPIRGQRGLVRADLSILFSPSEHPYLYVLGGFLGLLTIYGLWLEVVGLRNTGQKVSSTSAWSIALLLWGIGLILGLSLAALFPTFIT